MPSLRAAYLATMAVGLLTFRRNIAQLPADYFCSHSYSASSFHPFITERDRSRLRYPSDLTDEEWALVEPLIASAKRRSNKRTVDVREVVNRLMYVLSSGCQWRAIPKDLPPRSTLHGYFDLWTWDGTLDRIHRALYVQCRELANREPSPSAAIIDSQSVKSAEKGGPGLTRMATMRERRSRARSATS
jgi:transposase